MLVSSVQEIFFEMVDLQIVAIKLLKLSWVYTHGNSAGTSVALSVQQKLIVRPASVEGKVHTYAAFSATFSARTTVHLLE